MRDLMIVDCVNRQINDRMPVYPNHLLYGGYLNMPSALMGKEGLVRVGYSYVPPYENVNLGFQFMDWIEISGNYRIFKGVDDPVLSHTGFGDKSDKGANLKLSLMRPEDSDYVLPGLAIGWEDFIGTKAFEARYIVATQVIPKWNFECSLGYGEKRIRGLFGGFTWIPFRKHCNPYLKDLALVAEYDAIPYKSKKREPHPDGRSQKSPINVGVKYRLWDFFDLSASYVRGEKFAFAASLDYNFGLTKGFFPKIDDPSPYRAPANTEPLGCRRPCDALACDLVFPFREQGFEVQNIWLYTDRSGRKNVRLSIVNFIYRNERDARNRISALLAFLIPEDIDWVTVVLEQDALPLQQYCFRMPFLRLFAENKVCPYELYLLSPMKDVSPFRSRRASLLYSARRDWWNLEIFPKTYSLFGSAKGKFKYALGVQVAMNGYLLDDWYYSLMLGYIFASDLGDVKDVDKLNPSQLINVRTDTINYFKQDGVTVDEAYVQKSWNLGCGFFGRLSGGLFEEAYGGAAVEALYYPTGSDWAFGIEGAYLRKRKYSGVSFANKIRKLEGYKPTYKHFRGSQYFLNLYYNFSPLDLDLHLKGGKFLANDWGLRTELSRYYPSGMRVFFWYTYTNGKDRVNGHRYYDKGVGISMPLDIFYTYSCRTNWNYGLSAWLRDVGASAFTGSPLYPLIRQNRENYVR